MFPVQIPPFLLPTPNNLRFRREGRYLKGLMREILMKRRASSTKDSDLLSYFFHTEDTEIKRKWTDDELISEMFVIFGTSAMTTALGWCLYLLAQHPSITRKLTGLLQDAFRDGTPAVEALEGIPFLDQVFREALRLYPPFWGSVRYSQTAIEMDGYQFPARSTFLPIRFFSQRHEDYWEHPLAFDPDRFDDSPRTHRTSKNNPANLLPFGAGPRTCLGVHLAPKICKLILAMVVHHYSLEFQDRRPNGEPRIKFSYGLYPADRVFIAFHDKTDQGAS
jgi:cytochrome P450